MPFLLVLLAIASVIVDDPSRWATGYGMLRHAQWDGVLPADLVTPVFLFFLGAAIALRKRPFPLRGLLGIAATLCAAGLAINGVWRADLATWRFTGVLQRAGATLAITAVAHAAATGDCRRRIAILASTATLITLTYWLVMAHVPVPNGTPGDLSPAGNLAAWVDRTLLGPHAWNGHWDPDGILSTLSSVSTTLAGLVAGIALTSKPRGLRPVLQLVVAGAAAMIAGILWTFMVPLNRSLWSGSFVVFSGGVATILLAGWSWRERRSGRSRSN
jgi:predicted acyltransferase